MDEWLTRKREMWDDMEVYTTKNRAKVSINASEGDIKAHPSV